MHSSNKALIVGTGFGNLYKSIYESMGWQVTTVDIADPSADFNKPQDVIEGGTGHGGHYFNTCHITTPNWTHLELAYLYAGHCDIMFVEKPGVFNQQQWAKLIGDHSDTRIMMTKNNQYRSNIAEMAEAADPKHGVTRIRWINDNRVPKPGSWFTNKNLAFGGVSRDLMPHLLSLYQMFEPNWRTTIPKWTKKEQRWVLSDFDNSDYGEVDPKGTYDVDDFCYIDFGDFQLCADWASKEGDDIAVHTQTKSFELGLCPEEAYKEMIVTAIFEHRNDEYWKLQQEMDIWIHQILSNL